MDLPTFRELLSKTGHSALAAASALAPTEAGFLGDFGKLRKRYPADLARAALETALLRIRAREKHSLANRLYFTRESLEQSSSDSVSRHRAERFRPFASVVDLCCGAGIDAIHLALAGCIVSAIDNDPLRLLMAQANADVCGVGERIRFLEGDVLTMPLPEADAAFVDPSRRDGDRRFLDPAKYQPPLAAVLARFATGFPLAAKIAPGVAHRDLDSFLLAGRASDGAETEFISSAGELKECVIWFGSLKTSQRRATVLAAPEDPSPGPSPKRGGEEDDDPAPPPRFGEGVGGRGLTLASDDALDDPSPSPIGEYIFDPDSSVIRAGLLPLLAEAIDAAPVDFGIAMLTGAKPAESPFADCYRVEHSAPFHVGKLREYLREQDVGRVTILKRAIDVDVNDVMKQLKLQGAEHRHVILTKSLGQRVAIVAAPLACLR